MQYASCKRGRFRSVYLYIFSVLTWIKILCFFAMVQIFWVFELTLMIWVFSAGISILTVYSISLSIYISPSFFLSLFLNGWQWSNQTLIVILVKLRLCHFSLFKRLLFIICYTMSGSLFYQFVLLGYCCLCRLLKNLQISIELKNKNANGWNCEEEKSNFN